MTEQEKLLDWVRNEVIIKYGDENGSIEKSDIGKAVLDVFEEIVRHDKKGVNIRQVADDIFTLVTKRTLSPVHDTEMDWILQKENGFYIHRRIPTLIKDEESGVCHRTDRFIVEELTKDGLTKRTPTDMELIIVASLHPIKFPYYPSFGYGTLITVKSEHYVTFLRYKDECSGEVIKLFKTFSVSEKDEWTPASGLSEMMKVSEEMDEVCGLAHFPKGIMNNQ